jgi:single-strand DNA-binding protein
MSVPLSAYYQAHKKRLTRHHIKRIVSAAVSNIYYLYKQAVLTGRLHYFWRFVMNNLNSILIEGNLVRDPEFRTTPKGTALCTFALASNRYFKQDAELQKEVSYFNVETWAKLAESVQRLGHKGRGVRVVGRLKQERWQNAEGQALSKVVIVAEHVEFRPEAKKEEPAETGETETAIYAPQGNAPEEAAALVSTF